MALNRSDKSRILRRYSPGMTRNSEMSTEPSLNLNNQLPGAMPPELGNLANLEVLGLYNNQLSGEMPRELALLDNLSILMFNGNRLTGSVPPE